MSPTAVAGLAGLAPALTLGLIGCLALSDAVPQRVGASESVVPVGFDLVAGWPELPGDWQLGDVAGVAVDSHDHVFVFHRGARHPIFALEGDSGRLVHAFGDGLFGRAHGLAVDADDQVWVTDLRRHQVLRFSHDGELLQEIGERGVAGDDARHFDQPTDVAIAGDGRVYVSDGYGNRRVVRLSADGRYLGEWGSAGSGPGQFDLPHGLALAPDGRVFVADRGNARIQVFDAEGGLLAVWGETSLGRRGRPWGLEFFKDHLYVIDGGDMDPQTPDVARLSVLDGEGAPVARWGAYGRAPGELLWGHDLAVGSDGSVYTAEVRDGDRVQKFRPRP